MADFDGKRLYIRPLIWVVSEVDSLPTDARAFGLEDIEVQEFRVAGKITDDLKVVTMLHEIMHALNDQNGLQQDEDNEDLLEQVIRIQSYNLLNVLQDPRNDWLTARIVGIDEHSLTAARDLA